MNRLYRDHPPSEALVASIRSFSGRLMRSSRSKQVSEQVGHLAALGAPIHVKLVDHKREDAARPSLATHASRQTALSSRSRRRQDVQHRVVGDEEVRRSLLHVPPRSHLSAIESRQVVGDPCVLRGIFLFHLSRSASAFVDRADRAPLRSRSRDVSLVRDPDMGAAGVPPEVEAMPGSVLGHPFSRHGAVQGFTEADELVLYEGVHGIEDERPHRCWPAGAFCALWTPATAAGPPVRADRRRVRPDL